MSENNCNHNLPSNVLCFECAKDNRPLELKEINFVVSISDDNEALDESVFALDKASDGIFDKMAAALDFLNGEASGSAKQRAIEKAVKAINAKSKVFHVKPEDVS